MAVDPGFRDFVQDQLSGLGPVSVRPMFGGAGVYADGVMFGLIAFDTLYFKGDETIAARFEQEGCAPFTYEGKGRPVKMSYWQVPERLFEDPDDMLDWAHQALAIARRSKAEQSGRSRTKRASL
ncbi:MAG: TfoX/Sxy family protein [Pseudomonadota bacterium]